MSTLIIIPFLQSSFTICKLESLTDDVQFVVKPNGGNVCSDKVLVTYSVVSFILFLFFTPKECVLFSRVTTYLIYLDFFLFL